MAFLKRIRVKICKGNPNTAYIKLPGHPVEIVGCVKKTIDLASVIEDYKGPRIHLDFNDAGILIGIEILA